MPKQSRNSGFILTKNALYTPGLTAIEKLVLALLADHADEQCVCHPSQGRLSSMAGCSRKAVNAALKRLAKIGLIEKLGDSHAGYTLHYRLHLKSWRENKHVYSSVNMGGSCNSTPHPCHPLCHPPVTHGTNPPITDGNTNISVSHKKPVTRNQGMITAPRSVNNSDIVSLRYYTRGIVKNKALQAGCNDDDATEVANEVCSMFDLYATQAKGFQLSDKTGRPVDDLRGYTKTACLKYGEDLISEHQLKTNTSLKREMQNNIRRL